MGEHATAIIKPMEKTIDDMQADWLKADTDVHKQAEFARIAEQIIAAGKRLARIAEVRK